MRTKIFPVDVGNRSEKLLKDIMKVLNKYRIEKYPDVRLFGYGMDIMKLFNEFSKEQEES